MNPRANKQEEGSGPAQADPRVEAEELRLEAEAIARLAYDRKRTITNVGGAKSEGWVAAADRAREPDLMEEEWEAVVDLLETIVKRRSSDPDPVRSALFKLRAFLASGDEVG